MVMMTMRRKMMVMMNMSICHDERGTWGIGEWWWRGEGDLEGLRGLRGFYSKRRKDGNQTKWYVFIIIIAGNRLSNVKACIV